MKKSLVFLMITISLVVMYCKKEQKDGYKWIVAKGGLNVRSQADLKSEVKALVPYGTKVRVVEETDKIIKVKDKETKKLISGKWTKINWDNLEGWAFGGYLATEDVYKQIVGQQKICDFVDQPFVNNLKEINLHTFTKDAAVKFFGKPKKIVETSISNVHDPDLKDKRYTIYYDRLVFKIYHAIQVKKQLVEEVRISNDKYPYLHSVKFKMKKEQIIEIFGNPKKSQPNQISYDCVKDTTENLFFNFDNNKLKEIVIQYYID